MMLQAPMLAATEKDTGEQFRNSFEVEQLQVGHGKGITFPWMLILTPHMQVATANELWQAATLTYYVAAHS